MVWRRDDRAFAVPTRDALLPTVGRPQPAARCGAGDGAAFIGQLLGIAAASEADRIGALPLLIAQSALVAAGALAVWRLPRPAPRPPVAHPSFWRSIGDGIVEAARSEQMWPVLLLNFGIGVFYVGPFMAVLPIVVRDVYHGGAAEIAYINLAFWAGTIIAAFASQAGAAVFPLRGRGGQRRVGRRRHPFLHGAASAVPGFNALCFVWGWARHHADPGPHHPADRGAATHRARLWRCSSSAWRRGPIGASSPARWRVLGLKLAMVLRRSPWRPDRPVLVFSRIWSMRTVE